MIVNDARGLEHPWVTNKLEPAQLQHWWTHTFQNFTKWVMGVLVRRKFDLVIEGQEHVPPNRPDSKPAMIVCTHSSGWDIPVLVTYTRTRLVSFIAKQELFRTRRMRWFFRTVATFSVNRDKLEVATIKSAKLVLSTPGWYLVMFPEGTRHTGEGIGEVKGGAAAIAKLGKAPVLPVGISYGPDKKVGMSFQPMLAFDPKESTEAYEARIVAALAKGKADAARLIAPKSPTP